MFAVWGLILKGLIRQVKTWTRKGCINFKMAAEGPGNSWTFNLCYNNYSRFQNLSLLRTSSESKSSHLYIILPSNNNCELLIKKNGLFHNKACQILQFVTTITFNIICFEGEHFVIYSVINIEFYVNSSGLKSRGFIPFHGLNITNCRAG